MRDSLNRVAFQPAAVAMAILGVGAALLAFSRHPLAALAIVLLFGLCLAGLLAWGRSRASRLADQVQEFSLRPEEAYPPCTELESLVGRLKQARSTVEQARAEQTTAVNRTEKLLYRRCNELKLLQLFLEALSQELDVADLAERALEEAGLVVSLEMAAVYSLAEDGRYQLEAAYGLTDEERARLAAIPLTTASAGFGELSQTGQVLRLQEEPLDAHPILRGRFPAERITAYYAISLASGGIHQGVLEVLPRTPEPLTGETLELLMSLARVVGTALQRNRLLMQLRREKQASEAVLEHMADGVFTLDARLRLTGFNQAAERITGWPRAQLLGLTVDEVFGDPESAQHLLQILDGSQPISSYEREVPVRDGVRKILAFSPTAFEGPSGPALIVVFRDISRIRELELLRGDFTATISHELRTPITSIKLNVHNMMHKKYRFDPEVTRSNLSIIGHQADRLSRLIQDLLEAARLDSQALEVRPRNVDVGTLISKVVDDYRNKEAVHPILWQPPEGLRVHCDPDQLRYVLDHLMSNAIKYSVPGGPVELAAELRGSLLAISVRDEGVGIPFDHQEKIFEKYHRVEVGNTRTHYGVGLGLFIARKVVEAHGGQITVSSVPGSGSTFTVTLPGAFVEKGRGPDSADPRKLGEAS
ncbi:MAG: ATP-binding protein [Candidatus Eremiobacterota bacterium]